MSAKLLKHVTITLPKSLLNTPSSQYPNPTVENDVKVEVKEQVIHKKKRVKPNDEQIDIYEKEYNTTSEYRRMKNLEVLGKDL